MAKHSTQPHPAAVSTTAAKQAHPRPAFPVLDDGIHDLDGLRAALGKPDEKLRRLIFRNHTETDFFEWGVEAASKDIMEDAPRFISSSVRILATLSPERLALVHVPPWLFAILADEAGTHVTMATSHATVSDTEGEALKKREGRLKKEMGLGVAMRDRVFGCLRNAVGDAGVTTIRAAATDASSPDALMKGLQTLASFIRATFESGSEDDKSALEAFQADEQCAADLEARAKSIKDASPTTAATGKRVSQRELDIQDGRVLVLMDIVVRAFKLARKSDGSILLPELNRLKALLDSRWKTSSKEPAEPPVNTAAKPNGSGKTDEAARPPA